MLFDRATIDGPARITRDGYFVADALVGRGNNIQDYLASELGLTDRAPTDVVRIFRPATEVFHKDALSSLAHRPVTLDHPSDPVDSANWKSHAVGDVGGDIMRDGDFIRVPLKIMDKSAVESVRTSRREFSLGYTAALDMTAGVHDGASYDGSMRDFKYNHLAAVPLARGGADLRIVDERINPPSNGDISVTKIKIGDAEVALSDAGAVAVAVGALQSQFADAQNKAAAAETQVATLTTQLADATAKVTTLEQAVKDAALSPQQLRDAAKAYAQTVDTAKKLAPTAAITDAMDEPAIKRAVVNARLGDAAKDWNDSQVDTSFATLSAQVGDAGNKVHDLGLPKPMNDTAAIRDRVRASRYA